LRGLFVCAPFRRNIGASDLRRGMHMKQALMIAGLSFLLSGCVAICYTKENWVAGEFERDREACEQQAKEQGVSLFSRGKYVDACLKEKGWHEKPR
jgi:hypothetical protein